MRHVFLFLGALVLALVPIAYLLLRAPAIQIKALPRKNATSYVFRCHFYDAFWMISIALGENSTRQGIVFRELSAPLTKSTLSDGQFGRVGSFASATHHDPIGKSAVYFARGEALDYLADFELHLVRRSETETEVQVKTLRPEVINGKKFGFGSCGPGFANRYVAVEPTTIEEYEILLRIGQALGEKDMPPLILPQ